MMSDIKPMLPDYHLYSFLLFFPVEQPIKIEIDIADRKIFEMLKQQTRPKCLIF